MRDVRSAVAYDGESALEILNEDEPDVIILDLKMPGIDGIEVLRKTKEKNPDTEVIILTGHGSVDSAVDCTKLGAFGYLPKPYELEKLLETLQQAYQLRMEKKFETDQARMEKIAELATGSSALSILRELRKVDDEEK